MKIHLASSRADGDYIRHVRRETLTSLGITPTPGAIEPVRCSQYLVAYDDLSRPIGLCESVMLNEIYDSYEDAPYGSLCDFHRYCPFRYMASTRTIYVEPESRGAKGVYMALALAAAKLLHGLGAQYAVANTLGSADALKHLYLKCGGELVGQTTHEEVDMAVFVFDLGLSLTHRVMQRVSRNFAFERMGRPWPRNRVDSCRGQSTVKA